MPFAVNPTTPKQRILKIILVAKIFDALSKYITQVGLYQKLSTKYPAVF